MKTLTLNLVNKKCYLMTMMVLLVLIAIGTEQINTVAVLRMKMWTWTSLNNSDENQLTSELILWPCAESCSNLNKSTNRSTQHRSVN